jgi:hypothetical protein
MPAAATTQRQAIAEYREQLRQELAVLHTRSHRPPAIASRSRAACSPCPTAPPPRPDRRGDPRLPKPQPVLGRLPYDPNHLEDPICWAVSRTYDDLAPSPDAPERQAERCNNCPKNVFGSAPNRKAKSLPEFEAPGDRAARRHAGDGADDPVREPHRDQRVRELRDRACRERREDAGRGGHAYRVRPDVGFPVAGFGKPKPLTDKQLAVMMALRAKAQPMLDLDGLGTRAEGDVPW